jgi:hypothetical protein
MDSVVGLWSFVLGAVILTRVFHARSMKQPGPGLQLRLLKSFFSLLTSSSVLCLWLDDLLTTTMVTFQNVRYLASGHT